MLFLGLIMDDSKRKGWSFIYWLWRGWTLGIRLKNCLLQGIVIEYSNCERLKNGKPCLTWTLAKIACLSLREIFNLHTKRNDDSSRKGTPAKGITLIISGAIPQAGVIDTSLNETWAVSTYKKRKVNKTTLTVGNGRAGEGQNIFWRIYPMWRLYWIEMTWKEIIWWWIMLPSILNTK